MYYSNRRWDVHVSKRMEYVMDAIYAMLGWQAWRPHDREWDKRGIDVVLQLPGMAEKLWVDEKVAARYWNRPLGTYACELSCEKNKNGYGWFAKENNGYMVNTHLLFVWVRALEPELKHISGLEYAVVKKRDLQRYFMLATGLMEEDDTLEYLERQHLLLGERRVINEQVSLMRCNIYPEFPTNAIFSKDILKTLAVETGEFSRFFVRDALREAHDRIWGKNQ